MPLGVRHPSSAQLSSAPWPNGASECRQRCCLVAAPSERSWRTTGLSLAGTAANELFPAPPSSIASRLATFTQKLGARGGHT